LGPPFSLQVTFFGLLFFLVYSRPPGPHCSLSALFFSRSFSFPEQLGKTSPPLPSPKNLFFEFAPRSAFSSYPRLCFFRYPLDNENVCRPVGPRPLHTNAGRMLLEIPVRPPSFFFFFSAGHMLKSGSDDRWPGLKGISSFKARLFS